MTHARPDEPVSSRLTLVMRWALVAVLGVLLISMATGQSGINNYIELKKNREALQQTVQELAINNQFLEQHLNKLKTSREIQIRYLKEEFGYVEPNEFVYHFEVKNKNSAKNLAAPQKLRTF